MALVLVHRPSRQRAGSPVLPMVTGEVPGAVFGDTVNTYIMCLNVLVVLEAMVIFLTDARTVSPLTGGNLAPLLVLSTRPLQLSGPCLLSGTARCSGPHPPPWTWATRVCRGRFCSFHGMGNFRALLWACKTFKDFTRFLLTFRVGRGLGDSLMLQKGEGPVVSPELAGPGARSSSGLLTQASTVRPCRLHDPGGAREPSPVLSAGVF